eukprot:6000550-Prymnesium_polylepis.1
MVVSLFEHCVITEYSARIRCNNNGQRDMEESVPAAYNAHNYAYHGTGREGITRVRATGRAHA